MESTQILDAEQVAEVSKALSDLDNKEESVVRTVTSFTDIVEQGKKDIAAPRKVNGVSLADMSPDEQKVFLDNFMEYNENMAKKRKAKGLKGNIEGNIIKRKKAREKAKKARRVK